MYAVRPNLIDTNETRQLKQLVITDNIDLVLTYTNNSVNW